MYNKCRFIQNSQKYKGGIDVKYIILIDDEAKNWLKTKGSTLTIEQLKGNGC